MNIHVLVSFLVSGQFCVGSLLSKNVATPQPTRTEFLGFSIFTPLVAMQQLGYLQWQKYHES